ncbi:MAG: peroxiredoxin [Planctomycetota bacterium]
MLKAGDKAPMFEAEADDGSTFRVADALQRGPVVVFFYPGDFTPLCTKQVCMVRDDFSQLKQAGVTVVGVNPASAAKHGKFSAAHSLPFPLLADAGKQLAKAFGATGPLGLGTRRVSFLIGTDGVVVDAVESNLGLGKHEELLKRAATLNNSSPAS